MAIESDQDRLDILKSLGEEYIIEGLKVYGVLNYQDFDTFDVNSAQQVMTVRTIDISHVSIGDSVRLDDDEWLIRNIEDSGDGMTWLQLEAQ